MSTSRKRSRKQDALRLLSTSTELRHVNRSKLVKYNEWENDFKSHSNDMTNPYSDKLLSKVVSLDDVFNENRPDTTASSDARDAKLFAKAGEAARQQIQSLHGSALDLDKLSLVLLNRYRSVQSHSVILDWSAFGRAVGGFWRRPPSITMLSSGFLDETIGTQRQKSSRAGQKRRTTRMETASQAKSAVDDRVHRISAQDLQARESASARRHLEIWTQLVEYETKHTFPKRTLIDGTQHRGIPIVEALFDPQSFSQTIENLFYFSMLVKQNRGMVFSDVTNEVFIAVGMPSDASMDSKRSSTRTNNDESTVNSSTSTTNATTTTQTARLERQLGKTQQMDFSLDISTYEQLLEVYQLRDKPALLHN